MRRGRSENLTTIANIGRMLRGEISEGGIRPCHLVNILGLCVVKPGTQDAKAAEKELCKALEHNKKCVQRMALRYLTVLRADGLARPETIEAIDKFIKNPSNKDACLTPEEEATLTGCH